jgi:2'-5' RNA ligase
VTLSTQHAEIAATYERMWADARAQLAEGTCNADEYLGGVRADDRVGITLVARPPSSLIEQLAETRRELAQRLAGHYLVPEADLHVTILSLEPVRSGFVPRGEVAAALGSAVDACDPHTAFPIEARGISGSPSAVVMCGYPGSTALNAFRDAVREVCRARDLAPLVDRRYAAHGAHSTMLRFVGGSFPAEQFPWLETLRRVPLGSHMLSRLELVTSDWYLRRANSSIFRIHRVWELEGRGA